MDGKKIILGVLTFLVLSGAVYVTFQDEIRIEVEEDKTQFKMPHESYSWIWTVVGEEENRLFDGASIMNRDRSEIEVEATFYNNSNFSKITRTTPYQRGAVVKDIYTFNGSQDDIELFPIQHKVRVLNASGKFYRYTADKLDETGEKRSFENQTSFEFGNNMSVQIDDGYRWAWIGYPYGEDSFSAQYDIESDNETFNVRLFDPRSRGNFPTFWGDDGQNRTNRTRFNVHNNQTNESLTKMGYFGSANRTVWNNASTLGLYGKINNTEKGSGHNQTYGYRTTENLAPITGYSGINRTWQMASDNRSICTFYTNENYTDYSRNCSYDPNTGLANYIPFDRQDELLQDYIRNYNIGTNSGTQTEGYVYNGITDLTGTMTTAQAGNFVSNYDGNWTAMMWAKINHTQNNSIEYFSDDQFQDGNFSYKVGYNHTTNRTYFKIGNTSKGNNQHIEVSKNLSEGWHHLAFQTIQTRNLTANLYVNSTLENTSTTNTFGYNTDETEFVIGNSLVTTAGEGFNHTIDDLRFYTKSPYNETIDRRQIIEAYNSTKKNRPYMLNRDPIVYNTLVQNPLTWSYGTASFFEMKVADENGNFNDSYFRSNISNGNFSNRSMPDETWSGEMFGVTNFRENLSAGYYCGTFYHEDDLNAKGNDSQTCWSIGKSNLSNHMKLNATNQSYPDNFVNASESARGDGDVNYTLTILNRSSGNVKHQNQSQGDGDFLYNKTIASGNYTAIYNSTNGTNYTGYELRENFTISKYNLTGSINASNVQYPEKASVNGSVNTLPEYLNISYSIFDLTSFSNVDSGQNNFTFNQRIGAEDYRARYLFVGNQNFTSLQVIEDFTVAKGNPEPNMTLSLKNATYPNNVSINASETNNYDNITYKLFVGNKNLENGSDINISRQFASRNYSTEYNTSGNENWTSGSITKTLAQTKGTPNLFLNATNRTYPEAFINASENNTGDADLVYKLFAPPRGNVKNGSNIIYNKSYHPIGNWTAEYNTTGGQNWTSASITDDFTIFDWITLSNPLNDIIFDPYHLNEQDVWAENQTFPKGAWNISTTWQNKWNITMSYNPDQQGWSFEASNDSLYWKTLNASKNKTIYTEVNGTSPNLDEVWVRADLDNPAFNWTGNFTFGVI